MPHAERVSSRARSAFHRAGRFFRAVAGWTREHAKRVSSRRSLFSVLWPGGRESTRSVFHRAGRFVRSGNAPDARGGFVRSAAFPFRDFLYLRMAAQSKGRFIVPRLIRLTVQTTSPSWWFTAQSVFLHRMHGKFSCAAAFSAKFCPARPRFCKLLLPENRGTNAVRPKGRTA